MSGVEQSARGQRSRALRRQPMTKTSSALELLRRFESRNVTSQTPDGSWPIVWEQARGCHVWDVEGQRYLDLTAAFGVAASGHGNPAVVRAGQRQMERLLHAMGDVHPHPLKGELLRELSRITFERWAPRSTARTILGNSGFEAVEAALKTARLATGRPEVIAFEGGYHGLGYGTLNVTHRNHFRGGFLNQLREFGRFVPFPKDATSLRRTDRLIRTLLRSGTIGAVLVEPIQARGGIRVPPKDFLPRLRRLCDQHGALLVVDEIYTGFGRTGRWFACEHSGVVPDLVCLGKALTGGFPLSACVGRASIMEVWPPSTGEAIHTSTFLGHPVGCAMALAQLNEIRRRDLVRRSAVVGAQLRKDLEGLTASGFTLEVRGQGLMAGLELSDAKGMPASAETFQLIKRLLRRGYVFLPEGEHGNVLGWTPPLTITTAQVRASVRAVARELKDLR